MSVVIAVPSQKGGVEKSITARGIAREYADAGWSVKIADLDISQGTSYDWHVRRLQQNLTPEIAVERFSTVEGALDGQCACFHHPQRRGGGMRCTVEHRQIVVEGGLHVRGHV